MNCTKNIQRNNSAVGIRNVGEAPHLAESNNSSFAVGTLTNYKRVVDIDMTASIKELHKIRHYGLSKNDLNLTTEKLKKQKQFLDFSFLYDRIMGNKIPLSDIFISANHSPNRYYAEVQNRVNTISVIAKERNLVPVFMTITLPSEYHPFKKDGVTANPNYNGSTPHEASMALTKMLSRLRHDRSLKELSKEERLFIKVNEPHKSGVPHMHLLFFIPDDRVERVKKAFKRLYNPKTNDIQSDIKNATSYVMKYINKTLPLSKADKLSEKDKYLNAWYSKNRIIRFSSSRTLAPLQIYRLLHNRFSMYAVTRLLNEKHLSVYVEIDSNKVMEILDEWGDIVYSRGYNYDVVTMGNVSRGDYFSNNSQTNDSAIGVSA